MASSSTSTSTEAVEQLSKTLKEGERLVGPTRRPDGTLRKPIKIRAGYVPQDEVAIYKSKGALWKKEMESQAQAQAQAGPPGYDPQDPEPESKSKSKSVKRNERKKEKKQQAALDRAKTSEQSADEENEETEQEPSQKAESLDSVASQMSQLGLSTTSAVGKSSSYSREGSNTGNPAVDIDKKIRALKKKIRLAEAQLQKASSEDLKPEQVEKVKKLEGWREELKLLESEKGAGSSAS